MAGSVPTCEHVKDVSMSKYGQTSCPFTFLLYYDDDDYYYYSLLISGSSGDRAIPCEALVLCSLLPPSLLLFGH